MISKNTEVSVLNKFTPSCPKCMRKITSLKLSSKSTLRVITSLSVAEVTKMVNPDIRRLTTFRVIQEDRDQIDFKGISSSQISYSCGFNQALIGWGQQSFLDQDLDKNAALFPLGLCKSEAGSIYGWMGGWAIYHILHGSVDLHALRI